MKALVFESHGGPERLGVVESPDAPEPGPGQVRVRLRFASLNHLDLFVLAGMPNVAVPLPQIPGADGAGEVESIGDGVEGLSPGDRVLVQPGLYCGVCEWCRAGEQSECESFQIVGEHVPGTFGELRTLPAQNLFRLPPEFPFPEAAAFPLAYQTAWRMIVGRAAVRPGETVLIHGIGGGVAWAALEIGLLCGACVFVTSSSDRKLEEARRAGAEGAFNYRSEDVARLAWKATGKRGFDVVLDSVGEATWMTSLRAAARGGRIVTCGATTGPNPSEEIRLIFWKQLSILGSTMANDREFRQMLSAVFSRRLPVRVDSVLPLSEAAEGYRRLAAGEHHGKIVFQI
jgi:NADPH:quinone reductase-like Zn-dependent oxidoreductase